VTAIRPGVDEYYAPLDDGLYPAGLLPALTVSILGAEPLPPLPIRRGESRALPAAAVDNLCGADIIRATTMPRLLSVRTALACAAVVCAAAVVAGAGYSTVGDWLKLPAGRPQLGNMHGDIAVSSKGEVFVSVQDPAAGLQVYAPDGTFLRNVTGAPSDFHGFVIRTQPEGEFLYGATLRGQTIVKMKLDGTIVMTIGSSAVPDEFKVRNARSNELQLLLTGLDVAPNGDIYVADGYASDYIHRFDKTGKYLASFGGKKAPYNFNTLHKLAIDTRFQPARLIAVDRANNRVVHLSLTGEFLGVVASDLLLPAAITLNGDNVIVGELRGRVTVLDKAGKVVERIGENTGEGVGTNQSKPEAWRPGLLLSPHGVAINGQGDLFVSEFNLYGRVHRFNRQ
jgi:hypothetical protein